MSKNEVILYFYHQFENRVTWVRAKKMAKTYRVLLPCAASDFKSTLTHEQGDETPAAAIERFREQQELLFKRSNARLWRLRDVTVAPLNASPASDIAI